MDYRGELAERLAARRQRAMGDLSEGALIELRAAVAQNPDDFIDTDEDAAFAELMQLLAAFERQRDAQDLLDDEEYYAARAQGLGALAIRADQLAQHSPDCADARLVALIAAELEPDSLLDDLLDLAERFPIEPGEGDLFDDVLARPALRVHAAVARTCLESARFKMALERCETLFAASGGDGIGARHTAALAFARLEDEAGFDRLDRRFDRAGSAWSHLARTILLFKLDRIDAATRALRGFDRLCRGGSYALLRPFFVDLYIPDRPQFTPGSFEESVLAVHEAEPVVADIPDFPSWAYSQDWFAGSAADYARSTGLDW